MTDSFVSALGTEATEQLAAIREYRLREGSDAGDLRLRAKMALGVVSAYVRLRATLANEKSNELIERRLLGPHLQQQPQLANGEEHA
jgi:hypothetical protein